MKKRLFAAATALSLCLSAIPQATAKEAVNLENMSDISYTLNENYNDAATKTEPINWRIERTGGNNSTALISEMPNEADKSVQIKNGSSSNKIMIFRDFTPISGKIMVQANIRPEDKNGSKNAFYLLDSNGTAAICILFSNGMISVNNGSNGTDITAFEAKKWYNVKVVLDTATHKYKLFVDGVRYLDGHSFRNNVSDIAAIKFGIDTGSSSEFYFDNVLIYENPISEATGDIVNVKDYGAIGDGTTDDTSALQAAIDACPLNGTVLLEGGVFLSKTIKLKGDMTFYISPDATLKGSANGDDYPELAGTTQTYNYNQKGVNRALVYADTVDNLTIVGGGTIDGNGNGFLTGKEKTRPSVLVLIGCTNIQICNIHIMNSGMWTLPLMSCDNVYIRDLTMHCVVAPNRDGVDICDCHNVLIENSSFKTDDDVICLKSGDARGIKNVLVRNCTALSTRANGVKLGTLAYGPVENITVEDCLVKDVKLGALNIEAVDGADVKGFYFNRIVIQNCALPFYVVLSDRGETPPNAEYHVGSIDGVYFENISADGFTRNNGCFIGGFERSLSVYRIKNIVFRNCDVVFAGGVQEIPNDPKEFTQGYPECVNHGTLPAYGLYLRHVNGVIIENCDFSSSTDDVRPAICYDDDVYNFGSAAGNEPAQIDFGPNLALNKPTASSTEEEDYKAIYATDGSQHTRWSVTFDSQGKGWIKVDLGAEMTVNTVVGDWESVPNDYVIEVSNDDATWVTVLKNTEHKDSAGVYVTTIDTFDAVSARYLRLTSNKGAYAGVYGTYLSLYELQIFNQKTKNFIVDDETGTAILMQSGLTVGDVSETVTDKEGNALDENKAIYTGSRVIINEAKYEVIVLGDVNGDGNINSTDFMQVRKAFLKLYSMNSLQGAAADVNRDNTVNSTDFMQIRKHFLGTFEITA